MQLQKQIRKAARAEEQPRFKTIKLESFNPVMKPGIEIVSAVMFRPTHITVTTVKRDV